MLNGKTAIVTGAAAGIGAAIALRFAEAGAHVIAADIRFTDAPPSAPHPSIHQSYLDVRGDDSWCSLIELAESRTQRLDILVNNAGINYTGGIADTPIDQWRDTFAVNTEGILLGCRHAVPVMTRSGGGSIINITAAAALRPGIHQVAYTASKAAAISLTQSVALWCAQSGSRIRCNSIAPGAVRTPVIESYFDKLGGAEAALKFFGGMHPIGRIGEPDEIAALALYLAGDASAFMTGANLMMDGGYTLATVDGGNKNR